MKLVTAPALWNWYTIPTLPGGPAPALVMVISYDYEMETVTSVGRNVSLARSTEIPRQNVEAPSETIWGMKTAVVPTGVGRLAISLQTFDTLFFRIHRDVAAGLDRQLVEWVTNNPDYLQRSL